MLKLLAFAAVCVLAVATYSPAQAGMERNPLPQTGANGAPPANAQNLPRQTFTGIVSDSYCTRHHFMLANATPEECVRYCIAHRGHYVLLVGDKVYTLMDQPGHTLDALAWKQARVTGSLVGDNVIEIDSVSPVGGAAAK